MPGKRGHIIALNSLRRAGKLRRWSGPPRRSARRRRIEAANRAVLPLTVDAPMRARPAWKAAAAAEYALLLAAIGIAALLTYQPLLNCLSGLLNRVIDIP